MRALETFPVSSHPQQVDHGHVHALRYRYFLARSQTLTGQALVRRSCSDFLDEFGFKSIELATLGKVPTWGGVRAQFSELCLKVHAENSQLMMDHGPLKGPWMTG